MKGEGTTMGSQFTASTAELRYQRYPFLGEDSKGENETEGGRLLDGRHLGGGADTVGCSLELGWVGMSLASFRSARRLS